MGQKIEPPIILEGLSEEQLTEFKSSHKIWQIRDIHDQQLRDLFEITHPSERLTGDFADRQQGFVVEHSGVNAGVWVYFPWSGEFVHMVGEQDYYKLRTNRNRNLIKDSEQQKLDNFSAAVAGMSVGGGIALGLVYSGISNQVRLADFDLLETPNLNRVRAKVSSLGQPKINVMAEQIYEINPFAVIDVYADGIGKENVSEFLAAPVRVVFDEIDDFEMKIRLRHEAKAKGIAVIMLTSLGDSVLIDVERYDLDQDIQIFNGMLGDLPDEILTGSIGEREKIKYAMQLVGVENIPTRALASLLEINQTLVGRPQLYSTIAIDGGLAAYLVKQIALGVDLPSGRTRLSLDKALGLQGLGEGDASREEILTQLALMTKK